MLNFDKLFTLAKENGISVYTMYQYLGISRSQIYRIKEGKVQANTLNNILQLLYEQTGNIYQLNDICEFTPNLNEENKKMKRINR